MKNHTRTDVAKLAGVSTATVSNVLNNKKNISDATRQRVLAVIQQLDYQPSMVARSLVTQETRQLCIILNDLENPYYSGVVQGFENEAWQEGYFVNVCSGYSDLATYCDSIISRRVDGVFITTVRHDNDDDHIQRLLKAGIKVVVSGCDEVDLKQISDLEIDYYDGMHQIVHHLYGLGHREISYLNGVPKTTTVDQRLDGYRQALLDHNLTYGDALLIFNRPPFETTLLSGQQMVQRLLQSGRSFSAIITTNDLMAMGVIRGLHQAGLRVPEDVSVVGIDNIRLAELWEPSLTTLSVPQRIMGVKAFHLLYTNIKMGNTGYFKLRPHLIERQSTGSANRGHLRS
ncbi:MAG: LacI family DNA-binding transcriptional regulator [Clostridiaceae bacterium]|nr:LacI family DNA-binding transcriptional regulator [Clostridiaceae bacterium]